MSRDAISELYMGRHCLWPRPAPPPRSYGGYANAAMVDRSPINEYYIHKAVATQSPQSLCFKCPELDIQDEMPHRKILGWKEITYGKFHQDIQQCAQYWLKTLPIPPGSVVGLWILGATYKDVVNLFALQLAGFVPQIFSLKIQSTQAAVYHFNLLDTTHIIHSPSAPVDEFSNQYQFHLYETVDLDQFPAQSLQSKFYLSPSKPNEDGQDVIMFHHTSGSTAGRPKLIKQTRRWIDGNARKTVPGLSKNTDIALAMNGFTHASQFTVSVEQFKVGACIVLLPWVDFTSAELIQIVTECKVNNLYQLTPILCRLIREAMTNSRLEELLRSLDHIVIGGAHFTDNERIWAMEKGFSITAVYAMTEVGITMSTREDALIFHPFQAEGLVYEFRAISYGEEGETKSSTRAVTLYEFIVSPNSVDCPDSSLCDSVDGYYHTKDIFEKVVPSGYKYRGRLDDMIMMSRGQKCDASYIENQVLITCKDLVLACVVVGSFRESPCLLAEPLAGQWNEALKKEIGQRATLINQDSFAHERIRAHHVLIVPSGSLPRTAKGNINRRAAEAAFKEDIDALYNAGL